MSISTDQKVTASHLKRNAYLYVRQPAAAGGECTRCGERSPQESAR
jgi:hypothetical protein